MHKRDGAAGQAGKAGDAFYDVAMGRVEIGIDGQHLELGDGHAHEAQRGMAGILDADVGPHFEGVVAGAQGVVGRVHAAVAQKRLALAGAEAGEGAASAQAFGVIYRCSLSRPTIVGGL